MAKERRSCLLYVRAIYSLQKKKEYIRHVDIAKELGYSKPSVTNAVRKLCSEGIVEADKGKGIILTEAGLELAERSARRCSILSSLFEELGIDSASADENAFLIQDLLSDEIIEKLQQNTVIPLNIN